MLQGETEKDVELSPAEYYTSKCVVIRVSSLQDETENLKQSAEEARRKASDQSEQLLAVMTTLKDEHSKVS